MDESDRTSIHEVMEQQTVSIAKAGITTSLNARASILAAANPLYGRYNPKRSAAQNINLPTSLLSRFDLMFLLLDRPDMDADLRLAHHITYVHTHNDFPPLEHEPLEKTMVRNYVALAKRCDPYISKELTEYIVGIYVNLRDEAGNDPDVQYTGARTLLAVLRLSTALARLRFDEVVQQADVEEALRLMHASKSSLIDSRTNKGRKTNPINDVYTIIVRLRDELGGDSVPVQTATDRAIAKGYTASVVTACLDEYEEMNIWQVSSGRSRKITFV